jgi:copper chaperone NosL
MLLLLIAVLGVIGVACSSSIDLEATPDVRVGEDICDECGMIISEEVYSSAYRLSDGAQKIFDDIGDMVVHYRLHDDDVAAFWVHDFESIEWIRAEDAFFVASYDLVTPMGHGIAAFTNRPAAEALADDLNGAVHTLDELLAQSISELPRHEHEDAETQHDDEDEDEPGVFDIFMQSPRDSFGS